MAKERYTDAELNVVAFDAEDVITTSINADDEVDIQVPDED